MEFAQAQAFVQKIIGTELCTGADETESACYFVSPIPRAFLEGVLGTDNVPDCFWGDVTNDQLNAIGTFLCNCGQAILSEAYKRLEATQDEVIAAMARSEGPG